MQGHHWSRPILDYLGSAILGYLGSAILDYLGSARS